MILLDSKIWVIQAMQLPLVALIVLLTFIIAQNIRSQNVLMVVDSNAPLIVKATKWVSFGLLCNIAYLICNILTVLEQVPVLKYIKDNNAYFISLFDLLTTFFFYMAFITWYNLKAKTGGHYKNPIIRILRSKAFWIQFIALITGLIGYQTFYSLKAQMQKATPTISSEVEYPITFHIFNFIAYTAVSSYFLRLQPIDTDENKRYKFKYYLAASFFIWALLQFLDPLSRSASWSPGTIGVIGFSLSFLSKVSILACFFSFYMTLEKNAILKQKVAAQKTAENTKELQKLINSITTAGNLERVVEVVLKTFTSSQLFYFDYAMILKVDQIQQRVFYVDSKTNISILHPKLWIPKEGITLDNHDIIATVVREKKLVHVHGDIINDTRINLDDPKSPLNREIFVTHSQHRLNRFIVPVIHLREKTVDAADQKDNKQVIALVEMGYNTSRSVSLRNEGELNIYLDNLAQTYRRLWEQLREEQIANILLECDRNCKDDHVNYLSTVLEHMCSYIHADFGVMAILHTAFSPHNPQSGIVHYNITDVLYKKVLQIFSEASQTKESEVEAIAENTKNKMAALLKAQSVKKFIIEFTEKETGVVYIFSRGADYFNDDNLFILEHIIAGLKNVYNEKKYHNSVAALVLPNYALTDPEENINPVIESIRQYLSTDFISVWLKDQNVIAHNQYVQKYATTGLGKMLGYGSKVIILNDENAIPVLRPVKLDTNNPEPANKEFWSHGNHYGLKSFVYVPLMSGDQQHGFIHIYFKKEIKELSSEEIRFLKLIAIKCALTLQVQDLVLAFTEISASLTQNNLNFTLKTITDKALELLNADPVILFKSKNGTEIFFKDVVYSRHNDFKNDNTERILSSKEDHVELAELIIKDKSKYFDNYDEYKKFIDKNPKKYDRTSKVAFWERESIKSMAGLKLVNRGKAVGVMFINFRRRINFTDEVKKIIQTFGDLAAGAIESGYTFERNRQYLLRNLKLSKPIINELLTAGALHDARKTYDSIHSKFFRLIKEIDMQDYSDLHTWVKRIREMLNDFEAPMRSLHAEFKKIATYYQSDETVNIRKNNISSIMDVQLDLIDPDIRRKYIKVIKSYETNIYVYCDEAQIGHVFYNLVNNACQAMSVRGHLEIRMSKSNDGKIKVEVIDDGVGISQNIYDIITEPYVTDKEGGSGLGLAISKLVIEQHGGTLSYSSSNKKTKFQVILPVEQNIPDKVIR
jgi:signal transduction histidine kinase